MPRTFRFFTSWIALSLLMTVMFLPSEAKAAVVTDTNGNTIQPFQAWANLASKRGLPTPDVSVDANNFGCPTIEDVFGCVYMNTSRIHICTMGCDTSQLYHTFWHEMGHVFSFISYRNVGFAFQRIIGDKRKWREGVGPPIEQFAEGYALCASNPKRIPTHVSYGYGYMPTQKQHVQVCKMLQRQKGLPMHTLDDIPTHQNAAPTSR